MVSILRRWFLVTLLIFSACEFIHADNPCRYEGPKGVIDLSSLGNNDGTAKFSDVSPGVASNYKFSYNPCKPFTEASCVNVAACQVSNDLAYRFTIGLQDTAVWNPGSGLGASPTITYTSDAKTTKVNLVCGGDQPDFEALGEAPTNFYTFRLTHKCACWDGCGGGPGPGTTTGGPGPGSTTSGGSSSSSSVSGGLVFIIILIVLSFVYLVGFALFYRFHQGKSGFDLIPHRLFWITLVSYTRNGFLYVFRCISGKGSSNYQSV